MKTRPVLLVALALAAPATVLAAGGEIVWSRPFTAPEGAAPPATGTDGSLYWSSRGLLHKANSQGQVQWHRGGTDTFTLGPGNRIYLAGTTEIAPVQSAIRAITTDNQLLWEYTDLAGIQGFVGGPDIGPDGNLYATADGPSDGPGTFSLTTSGAFRWNVSNFGNIAGTPASHLVFSAQGVYKADNITPTQTGLYAGLIAMRQDSGSIQWMQNYAVPGSGPGRQPRVNPISGEINTSRWYSLIESRRADGSVSWSYPLTSYGYTVSEIDVGPDGSIYALNGDRDLVSLTATGQLRWNTPLVVPGLSGGAFGTPPVVSPDGQTVVFATTACFGSACPGSVVALNAASGVVRWSIPLPADPAGVPSVSQAPTFSPDSSLVYIAANTSASTSRLYAICVSGSCAPAACYANCDQSTAAPILNANDFQCFLNQFAGGASAANCDNSTAPPTLNANDFQCFLNRFAAGCP